MSLLMVLFFICELILLHLSHGRLTLDFFFGNQTTTIPYATALFGSAINGSLYQEVVLAYPDSRACTSLGNATTARTRDGRSYQGKIMLINRGICSFSAKADIAFSAGAAGIIVYNCSPDPPTYCIDGLEIMQASSDAPNLPSFFIRNDDALPIVRALNSNMTVNVSIAGTGPIDMNDLAALKSFVQSGTFNPTQMPGGNRDWSSLFESYSLETDPCLNRVYGIWCINGRVVQLQCSECSFNGSLVPELARLTEIIKIDLSTNSMSGAITCEFSQLHKLEILYLDKNNFDNISPCIGNLSSLQALSLSYNSLSGPLPNNILYCSNLSYIDITGNSISQVPDLSRLSQLIYVGLSQNIISQRILSFKNMNSLQQISLSNNLFTGPMGSDFFDNIPNLIDIDISSNKIYGNLPNFDGTTNLVNIDFRANLFSGTFPSTWGSFLNLKIIRLSHNQLVSPFSVFQNAISLQVIDFSYNQFTTISSPNTSLDVSEFIFGNMPNSIQRIEFQHNNLSGSWLNGWTGQITNLIHIDLSNNDISGRIPSDVFLWSSSNVQTVDLSFNDLEGSLPRDIPQISINILRFEGNPRMRGYIPDWAVASSNYIKASVSQRYSCPSYESKDHEVLLTLDPSYDDYKSCICDPGTYLSPPSCADIPSSVLHSNDTIIDPIAFPFSVNDSVFGNHRKTTGLDVAWVIDYPLWMRNGVYAFNISSSNNTYSLTQLANIESNMQWRRLFAQNTLVRAINITFTFYEDWNEFTDILEIYQGGDDLKGEKVVTYRGTDKFPIGPNNTVTVFSSVATINFRSRSPSGLHFTASYSFYPFCPEGYSPPVYNSEVTGLYSRTCLLDEPKYKLPPALPKAVYSVSAITLAVIAIVLGIVTYQRRTVLIRSSSFLFCVLMLFFIAMLAVGSIFYAFSAEDGAYVCDIRVWFTGLGLVGILSCLTAKTERIRKIFVSKQLRTRAITKWDVLSYVLCMLLVELLFLAIFSGLKLSQRIYVSGTGSTRGMMVYQCSNEAGHSEWLGFQLAYVASILLFASFVAFHTRNTPDAYNESSHILATLFVLTFFFALILPIQYLVDDNPASLVLIRGIGQSFGAFSLLSALFGPKLFIVFIGQANDRNMTLSMTAKSNPRERMEDDTDNHTTPTYAPPRSAVKKESKAPASPSNTTSNIPDPTHSRVQSKALASNTAANNSGSNVETRI